MQSLPPKKAQRQYEPEISPEEMRDMTPNDRMALVERLRRGYYGETYAEAEAAFPGTLEVLRTSDQDVENAVPILSFPSKASKL